MTKDDVKPSLANPRSANVPYLRPVWFNPPNRGASVHSGHKMYMVPSLRLGLGQIHGGKKTFHIHFPPLPNVDDPPSSVHRGGFIYLHVPKNVNPLELLPHVHLHFPAGISPAQYMKMVGKNVHVHFPRVITKTSNILNGWVPVSLLQRPPAGAHQSFRGGEVEVGVNRE